jgi:restriction system protein
MAVWVVRGGQRGEFEEFALNSNVVGIDFSLRQSVVEFRDRDALLANLLSKVSPDDGGKGVPNAASQLWRFAHELDRGDMVVLPCKQSRLVAVGKITGDYRFEATAQFPHIRSVEWDAVDLPRTSFDQDLLYSFGSLLTVFQVNRTNAQERIEQVVSRHLGKELPSGGPIFAENAVDDGVLSVDWDEVISDYIIERIRQKFTGHRLEYLVESILRTEGYTTLQTRPGADGGIDIVAGKGQMGFEEPRLCVQVKSGVAPVELPDYNRLQGNVHSFGAHHGLLVSLSDFTRAVRNENERSFFEIRLWGSRELTRNLLEAYDDLPADIRGDIPLVARKVPPETEV